MQLQIHKLHDLVSKSHIQQFSFFNFSSTQRNIFFLNAQLLYCMCGLKCVQPPFYLSNDLLLITGGLHLLRGSSLHRCCFAYDPWDCYSHRSLLPICKDSLVKFFQIFLLLSASFNSSSIGVYMCDQFSHLQGLFYVTQQVPWLHMLYAAIGAIVYTLVSKTWHNFLESTSALCFYVL